MVEAPCPCRRSRGKRSQRGRPRDGTGQVQGDYHDGSQAAVTGSAANPETGKAVHRTTSDLIRKNGKWRRCRNGARRPPVYWAQDADEAHRRLQGEGRRSRVSHPSDAQRRFEIRKPTTEVGVSRTLATRGRRAADRRWEVWKTVGTASAGLRKADVHPTSPKPPLSTLTRPSRRRQQTVGSAEKRTFAPDLTRPK